MRTREDRSVEPPTADMDRVSVRAGYRLVALWNGGSVVREVPPRGTLAIGRGDDVDVRLDHESVSRRHALLHLGVPLHVEDLGSSNGTFLRLMGEGEVANGDVLLMGQQLFRISM